jgi:hypothetical protein
MRLKNSQMPNLADTRRALQDRYSLMTYFVDAFRAGRADRTFNLAKSGFKHGLFSWQHRQHRTLLSASG